MVNWKQPEGREEEAEEEEEEEEEEGCFIDEGNGAKWSGH